ncbi:hypothetical protein HK097_004794 [Rhizophlyctis rosea]|uniref:Glutaredoxin-like protein n=1 Tax=Rhizophlyctis rosea TaxID=64517 RepID=A0AAD5S384_9FUNG|nr:hypothetical protein HK097_004794 [Rhizophlyctis rosea]
MASKRILTLFTRKYCGICEDAKDQILAIQQKIPFTFNEVDIDQPQHRQYLRKYNFDIPVIHWNDSLLMMHRIERSDLEKALLQETSGKSQVNEGNPARNPSNSSGGSGNGGNSSSGVGSL